MALPPVPPGPTGPRRVATGFTTAFLGDERTLREFVVGDHVRRRIVDGGELAVLYLINDSHDALTFRQLRIGVEKNEVLLRRFEPFCGRPIAEVPDPFGCHESYSAHFTEALVARLRALDIHPVVLDAWAAYRAGYYRAHVAATLARHDEILARIRERFGTDSEPRLFAPRCLRCERIDRTRIHAVAADEVAFECEPCGTRTVQSAGEVRGKLGWKLDCAARWEIYGIDVEVFSKAHFGDVGTLDVSKLVAEEFYGSRVPEAILYGDLQIAGDVAGRLLKMLPPDLLKAMLTANVGRDLLVTSDFVLNFSRKFEIRPGVAWVDWVRTELPRRALEADARDLAPLIPYGNAFSRHYWSREYGVALPDGSVLESADPGTAEVARDVIGRALALRRAAPGADVAGAIRAYLASRDRAPGAYPFLRRLLRQAQGPNIATLLAILPEDYLRTVHLLLTHVAAASRAALAGGDP